MIWLTVLAWSTVVLNAVVYFNARRQFAAAKKMREEALMFMDQVAEAIKAARK